MYKISTTCTDETSVSTRLGNHGTRTTDKNLILDARKLGFTGNPDNPKMKIFDRYAPIGVIICNQINVVAEES